jgi:hypothetical protein
MILPVDYAKFGELSLDGMLDLVGRGLSIKLIVMSDGCPDLPVGLAVHEPVLGLARITEFYVF